MEESIKQKKDKAVWNFIFNTIKFIVLFPYRIVKAFVLTVINLRKITKEKDSLQKETKNESINPSQTKEQDYEELRVLFGNKNDYNAWSKKVAESDSVIGIILGARGSGKSAIGIRIVENMHARYNKKCFAIGFNKEEMPRWIGVVEKIEDIKNDSFVLIDEGGILFNSRNSMSDANKMLSELLLIARHKNLSILFISQNSSNLEINILRQADFLILKPSSLLQSSFERKIIQKLYENTEEGFKKYSKDRGTAYIYSDEFRGFVSNTLPSFWNTRISKSFR